MRTRTHDQVAGLLLVHAGDLRQLIGRQFGQIVTRMYATLSQFGSQVRCYAIEFEQILRGFQAFFLGNRLVSKALRARARSSLMVSSSKASISQFLHGDIGDLFQTGKPSSIRISATSSSHPACP
ncbi:hypothetical protein D555_2970 [Bordetella holmesii 35009]|nr:hypothetical protein D555_2970 [Bordetella holmesii 35009]